MHRDLFKFNATSFLIGLQSATLAIGALANAADCPPIYATVRVSAGNDGPGSDQASGTIIGTSGEHVIVVTCGHVFRDARHGLLIDVYGPLPFQKPATLRACNLFSDVAIVSFVASGAELAMLPLGAALPQVGEPVTSLGCGRGGAPTAEASRVISINRYNGPENIEAFGQPVKGRSGGALVNSAGQVIGVCNAGDPRTNEGIYAGLASIRAELTRAGIAGYRQSDGSPATHLEETQYRCFTNQYGQQQCTTQNQYPPAPPQRPVDLGPINARLTRIEAWMVNLKLPAGPAGATGPAGSPGPRGPKGDAGAAGQDGATGSVDQAAINTAVATALANTRLPVEVLDPNGNVRQQAAIALDGKQPLRLQLMPVKPGAR